MLEVKEIKRISSSHTVITTTDGARFHRKGGSVIQVGEKTLFQGGVPCYPDGERWALFNDSHR